ncbi:hypothetical protein [Burkholderia ambifaria]|uniref:hypothetical protein n=1 Tax=Burkholderia ambifaria TaxID=152480 RepID=UPI0017894A4A|nr:hypothetical protein [Burkholderia ambifaria]MBY4766152.1 hypothetical protein [Burkholderia ambifaria]
MVIGSGLWMEGAGRGVQYRPRYALETVSEQGFGIGEKVAHAVLTGSTMPLDIAGRPGETGSGQPFQTCP